MKLLSLRLILLGTLCITSLSAHAVFIGNDQGRAEFPQGALSFTDALVAYNPVIRNNEPTPNFRQPLNAVGLPDHTAAENNNPCPPGGTCSAVSLGDGGSITLRFVDNRLTGSGNNQADLWVFEVGTDIEDTFVEISQDGNLWHGVGKVFGSTAGIDIDAYGWTTAHQFAFVRLRDNPALDAQVGTSVGADIDAVGAISTVAVVREPATWALMLGGAALLAARCRRSVAR